MKYYWKQYDDLELFGPFATEKQAVDAARECLRASYQSACGCLRSDDDGKGGWTQPVVILAEVTRYTPEYDIKVTMKKGHE